MADGQRLIRSLFLVLVATGVTGCGLPPPSPPLTQSPSPARSQVQPSASADSFEALATRPVAPPAGPREPCPVSDVAEIHSEIAPASGTGPIYAVLGANAGRAPLSEITVTAFGREWQQIKTLWVSTDPADGRILVRVAGFDPASPAGFIRGAAPAEDGLPTQLRLGPERGVIFGDGPMPEGWRAWSSGTLVLGVGCYAFQIDTYRATASVVFEVVE